MRILFFVLFLLKSISCFAQQQIGGTVYEAGSKLTLPYVNIGVYQKNIGSISNSKGQFSILIPDSNISDTLTFSMLGYQPLFIPIKSIINKEVLLELTKKPIELNGVSILEKKFRERKVGIKNSGALLHFTDGSTNQNDIFEIGQLVKLGPAVSKITEVCLHINESRRDSGTFRINFYQFENNRPGQSLISQSIIRTKEIKEGWLSFDLHENNIYLKGNVIAAIEFIPTQKRISPIYYEVKLGGSSRSFVRMSSQGSWAVPPHHYKMYVTTLVDEEGNKEKEVEERETKADNVFYSQAVQDSFYVFINLPKGYSRESKEKYPVIYLTDANAYFDIVANEMSEQNIEAILVGIGYKDFITMDSLRNRDYTYPVAIPEDSFSISGGADKFLRFINEELTTYIDKSYSTDTTNRTLMGHSLGGYFTLYALEESLINNEKSFHNFISASPSLVYAKSFLIDRINTISTNTSTNQHLIITCGSGEDSEEEDTSNTTLSNLELFERIIKSKTNLKIQKQIFPNFGHMETAIPTFIMGIKNCTD